MEHKNHCFLVLSSYGIYELECMLNSFGNHDNFHFCIHVDANTKDQLTDEKINELSHKYHIDRIYHKYNSPRFSSNLIRMQYDVLKTNIEMGNKYDFYHFVSDSCALIKSQQKFIDFFDHQTKSCVSYYDRFTLNDVIYYKSSQWQSYNSQLAFQLYDYIERYNLLEYYIDVYERLYAVNDKFNYSCDVTEYFGAVDEFVFINIIIYNIYLHNFNNINKDIDCCSRRYVNWDNPYRPSPILLSKYKNNEYDNNKLHNSYIARKIDWYNDDSVSFVNYMKTL